MAQAPASNSTQYAVAMTFSQAQQAGQLVSLLDSKGNALFTFAPKRQYESVVISTPALEKDGTYTLATGGTSTGTVTDGLYTGGTYQGGKSVVSFPLATIPTWINESGVTTGGGGVGPGGGMRGPGRK